MGSRVAPGNLVTIIDPFLSIPGSTWPLYNSDTNIHLLLSFFTSNAGGATKFNHMLIEYNVGKTWNQSAKVESRWQRRRVQMMSGQRRWAGCTFENCRPPEALSGIYWGCYLRGRLHVQFCSFHSEDKKWHLKSYRICVNGHDYVSDKASHLPSNRTQNRTWNRTRNSMSLK
jgi:hypothetical protein